MLVWAACASFASATFAADSDGVTFFREKIEPVLKQHCYECHSGQSDKLQGGLRLDSHAGLLKGGDSGPGIELGNASASLIIKAIRHEGGLMMPPEKEKLPDSTIADFVQWGELGFPDPRTESLVDNPADHLAEARQHWSFQAIAKPRPPTNRNDVWEQTAVDSFILSKLEERDWQPSSAATREELIRRVSFDLTGLPPSPDAITEFVVDSRPDAYARLVDQLLASPQYGERWAQHWLDVIRYAETEGYEYDRHLPDAWRFRDFAIESMNADKPLDKFLIEQLAGDEIDPANETFQVASIFHRLGAVRRNAGNPEIALSRNEVLTERTDIIGTAFLGLTIGCARCHNHKLEPISQKDYYRLQAYFAATDEHNIVLATPSEQKDREVAVSRFKTEIDELRKQISKSSGGQKVNLEEQIARLEQQLPASFGVIPATWNDAEKRTAIHVLRRGIWEKKGEPVGPRPPSIVVAEDFPELEPGAANPRIQLARWIASPDNPLTARVLVNRVWQAHFGTGLVKTANDFGLKGERPSHPELLDWLARTFIDSGWRMKPLHRAIVMSATYQQSSHAAEGRGYETADPENRLLWQFPRRRLSAEEVRDAMLVVSGRINLKSGGPSIMVPVEAELVQLLYNPGQWSVTKDPAEHDRRTVYLIAKRNLRLPFLENFDAPALQSSCARRESSTHAPQALEMLNGRLSNELARSFALRLQTESNGDNDRLIARAFELAFGHPPSPADRQRSLDFLRDQPLAEFALALFNLNEFLYVR